MTKSDEFWRDQSKQSWVKSQIVAKYCSAYAKIMASRGGATYLDLFSGRGEYEDGTPSTPILILNLLQILDPIVNNTKLYFFESDAKLCSHLKMCIEQHPMASRLVFSPRVSNESISTDLIDRLPEADNTFAFIDPFGLKGLNLSLLVGMIKRLRGDCLFLLSTSSVRRNLESSVMETELESLFGHNALERIRNLRFVGNNAKFEDTVYVELIEVIRSTIGPLFSLRFGIEFPDKDLESHSLVFITKDDLGFKIMKDIMCHLSEKDSDDFPLYRFSCDKDRNSDQLLLKVDTALIQLGERIAKQFAGRAMKVEELFVELDRSGEIYTRKNYRKALNYLMDKKVLEIVPTEGKPKRLTQSSLIRIIRGD